MKTKLFIHRFSVALVGAAFISLFGVTKAQAVDVDQSPLIVAEPLPPNIMLMHDDSGSMTWGFMPSWEEMPNTNDETLRASEVNRLYYNPSMTYDPPLKANGVSYPELDSFPNAPVDGLDTGSSSVNIENYTMQDPIYNSYEFPLFKRLGEGDFECPPGTSPSNSYPGECYSSSDYSGEYVFYTGRFYDSSNNYWYYDEVAGVGCPPGTDSSNKYPGKCYTRDELGERTIDYGDGNLRQNGYYYYSQICIDDGCVPPKNVFAYSLGNSSPYAEKFVTDDCSEIPTQYQSDCDDSVETKRNVAHWFSYYRTRELAAKSGILTAFSGINPEYRVGYASINKNNGSSAPLRFGSRAQADLSDDTYPSHVNRENFWRWMEGIDSSGSTPLRRSLKRVGEYYKNEDIPWQEGYDEDGNYSTEKYSCRQSYTILLTDGYWNGGSPSVGNADNIDGEEILPADGDDPYQYEAEAPFSDDSSNTLADVAMAYWKTDLRSDLKNDVRATDRDPAFWQHMTTFTIGLGVSPVNIEPSDATLPDIFAWSRTGADPDFDSNQFAWPEPEGNEPETVTDLAHAAVNGHGGFYSAADPDTFTRGLQEALAAIDNVPGAGNSVSLSGGSRSVVKDGSLSFVGKYVTGDWSGSLTAYSYSSDDGAFNTQEWSAASQIPTAVDRNIWTTDDGNVVEFMASALSNDIKTTLSDNLDTSFAVSGDDIVEYLRGVRSYEDADSSPLNDKKTLRQRASLLGDIVSSTPVPVGAPEPAASAFDYAASGFDGLDDYSDFANDNSDREPMVYVASNDGMLHAFKQSSGDEVFAFLPGSLLAADGDASLARYAHPKYGDYDEVSGQQEIPHQYFNDGEMATENVFVDGEWKTILVGTTGRGPARTVYAIDVTDPDVLADPDSAEDAILWERSAADGGDYQWIGQVLGRPTIWQVPGNGNNTKWVALIGNGPNSVDGEAALLQFDLADGALEVIETNTQTDNGLAAPTVIMTNPAGGIADYAFAGDLRGNVWQFDLDQGTSEKVFEAVGPDGDEQPITARMNATSHPQDGSIWLFFGTGQFLSEGDIDRREVQSLYGLRVIQRTSGKPVVDDDSTRDNDLVERVIEAQEENGDVIERATELGSESDLFGKAGWYMDLIYDNEAEGERVLNIAQLVAGSLYVTTMIPIAGDPCSSLPPGATMILDPFSGANPGSEFLDLDGDGAYESIGDLPTNSYISKVGFAGAPTFGINEAGETFGVALDLEGGLGTPPTPPAGSGGATRLNWQELYVR